MPYIKQTDRDRIVAIHGSTDDGPKIELNLSLEPKMDKGALNYCITNLIHSYVHLKGHNYQNISDAIAACSDAGEEFRRRVMNPYEDSKIELNGDIKL